MRFNGNRIPFWLQLVFFVFGFVCIVKWIIDSVVVGAGIGFIVMAVCFVGIWGYGLYNLILSKVLEVRASRLTEDPNRLKGRAWDRSANDYRRPSADLSQSRFCPYCGAATEKDFDYCNICGKPLPK